MKETQMPPGHAANLVANSGNTTYGVKNIPSQQETFPQRSLEVVFRLTQNKFPNNIFGTFWKRYTIFSQ